LPKNANQFIELSKIMLPLAKQIIHAYVREMKIQEEDNKMKPSTIKNRLKPIKAVLAANEIDFSWKLIDKGLPRPGKAPDRSYTREEIQTMLVHSVDILDKVIIKLFSSAGFRLEVWDYFTWNDVIFFYTESQSCKGMAIRVYAGYAEEYWIFGTPGAAKILLKYKETWKARFGAYPEKGDPLLAAAKVAVPKRLRMNGVRTRVVRLLRKSGVRPILENAI